MLRYGKKQFVLSDIKEHQFSVMVRSVLAILTQPLRMHNSVYHDRGFVAFLIISSVPLKGPEDERIRWNITVTQPIFKYFYVHSDTTFANGAYITIIFFLSTDYLYNNIPEFSTPCLEHPVYRHQSLTAYYNSRLLKSALRFMFRIS